MTDGAEARVFSKGVRFYGPGQRGPPLAGRPTPGVGEEVGNH